LGALPGSQSPVSCNGTCVAHCGAAPTSEAPGDGRLVWGGNSDSSSYRAAQTHTFAPSFLLSTWIVFSLRIVGREGDTGYIQTRGPRNLDRGGEYAGPTLAPFDPQVCAVSESSPEHKRTAALQPIAENLFLDRYRRSSCPLILPCSYAELSAPLDCGSDPIVDSSFFRCGTTR
jgi:hypothetical protein